MMSGWRPPSLGTVGAWWRGLPPPVRWSVWASLAFLALAPAWRVYAAWWDAWNGPGAFYDRFLPVAR